MQRQSYDKCENWLWAHQTPTSIRIIWQWGAEAPLEVQLPRGDEHRHPFPHQPPLPLTNHHFHLYVKMLLRLLLTHQPMLVSQSPRQQQEPRLQVIMSVVGLVQPPPLTLLLLLPPPRQPLTQLTRQLNLLPLLVTILLLITILLLQMEHN